MQVRQSRRRAGADRCRLASASADRRAGAVEEVDQGRPGADDEGADQRVEDLRLAVRGVAEVVGFAAERPLRGADQQAGGAAEQRDRRRAR